MSISALVSRAWNYYARHGSYQSFVRAVLSTRRALFANRMVIFYCDLSDETKTSLLTLSGSLKVECKKRIAELSEQELTDLTSFWNPKLVSKNIIDRFDAGAWLWLIKSEGALAGYGWTLRGRTIEQHYFPLGPRDAHLFDFHVFPEYRGRGINPMLVTYILQQLIFECAGRAYIEAAEWNQSQLSSLSKTPFHRLASASKLTIFGRSFVRWS